MCSIFGIASKIKINTSLFEKSAKLMTHRGPDHYGSWESKDKNLILSSSRLALNDLSSNGHQPMSDHTDKYKIVFNGEIYNFKGLKKELLKNNSKFINNSDTEVILEGYKLWGIDTLLKKIRGMYAFSLIDQENNKLFLARDAHGQKPLFYFFDNNHLIFSSEIKSIINYTGEKKLDYNSAQSVFLTTSIAPENKTLFKGIKKLNLGEMLTLNLNDFSFSKKRYNLLKDRINKDDFYYNNSLSFEKICNKFDTLLTESVAEHFEADAPVGIMFSAGLDSTLIAAIAKKCSNKPVHLFKFSSENLKDDKLAKDFAEKFNMKLIEVKSSAEEMLLNLPKIIYHYETINKCEGPALGKTCKIAREHGFKALLTGDASDELFGGYYSQQSFLLRTFLQNNIFTPKISSYLSKAIPFFKYLQFPKWDYILNPFTPDITEGPLNFLFWKGHRLKEWNESCEAYSFLKSKTIAEVNSYLLDELQYRLERFMIRADSYGMMESVELRLPFLDKRVVNFALNLSVKNKIKFGPSWKRKSLFTGKKINRQVAKKYGINNSIVNRVQIGTPYPGRNLEKKLIGKWPLKNLANFFEINEKKMVYNLLNIKDNEQLIWCFLSSEMFLRIFFKNETIESIQEELKKAIR